MSGHHDLRGFLVQAEAAGEPIVHVARRVSPVHELSAVVKALEQRGNPIVVFDEVEGSAMPVVDGVFASRRRIALALGVAPRLMAERYLDLLARPIDSVVVAAAAPAQESVTSGADVDLGSLPICVHAAGDAGRYITSGVCLARDPESGAVNAGIYRTMVKGPDRLTLSVDAGQDLDRILRAASEREEPVDVAIVVGGHPALAIASQAKVPISVDSLDLTGGLLGAPLEVTPGATVDLPVPARADVVIEGRILPGVTEPEGPFGEFSYYYGSDDGWVCEVTAITSRADAIWLDIHPIHREHRILGIAPGREARLLDTLRRTLPGVRAVHVPMASAGMIACVSIEKRHDGDPRQAGMVALGVDPLLKHVVVVDDDIDPEDAEQVVWALAVRLQADRDLLVVPYAKGFPEDPSSYSFASRLDPRGLTTKTTVDATLPLEIERPRRADEVPAGFVEIDLDDYISPAD
ncbi:MAG: UbiD family decarboxylase [Actinobacteria bacterium]|nr:UbiD family decarboxylase [Actinomycetota bacterium]